MKVKSQVGRITFRARVRRVRICFWGSINGFVVWFDTSTWSEFDIWQISEISSARVKTKEIRFRITSRVRSMLRWSPRL